MVQSFEEFITATGGNISVLSLTVNLVLAAIMSIGLSWVYVKFGNSLSNRKQFGKNFLLITMTTMLIITIVKSSLALSLGLVGALSIIRFRSAIKEPEELAYLFMSIAIGLGLGANQTLVTLLACAIILIVVIIAKKMSYKSYNDSNLLVTIVSDDKKENYAEEILEIMKKHCDVVNLRRLDESKSMLEFSLMVEVSSFKKLNDAKSELQQMNDALKITFLDNKGLI